MEVSRCSMQVSARSVKLGRGRSSPVFKKCLISRKIHGLPVAALPTMMASTPVSSKRCLAISGEVISPFPMIGIWIWGWFFTSPMSVQSASPIYICGRVRPWMVSAWMPMSCNRRAMSTIGLSELSYPKRVFTVTGIFTASTIALVMATIFGMSFKIPEPEPLEATFRTGQPQLMSITSGFADWATNAASTIA